MDCKEAIKIFENNTKKSVVQIERCSVGIANYVFIVSTATEKFILRCSKDEDAYKDTVYWLNKLSVCEIPIPVVLSEGKYKDYSYLILSYIRGDDIGNVYCKLNDSEKKQIAKEVVEIQRKVSKIDIRADEEWTWNGFVDEMLDRAEERIKRKHYFDVNKIYIIKKLQQEIQEYLDRVRPTPYLDDISTKNLLIYEGKVSGVIDIDWMGLGDMLTFVAMTKVALLNMDLDTKYIDYLLDEIHPNMVEYKAFVFYCLVFCVDFMGERGMQFLDKTVPVNESIIKRLNDIFDILMEEWNELAESGRIVTGLNVTEQCINSMNESEAKNNDREHILNHFYTDCCDEEQRLLSRHGSIEFLTTTRYIERYLERGNKILEVGAGTGRYSLYYAKRGFDVTSIEYVGHNLDVLKSNMTASMQIRAEQGDAVDLSRFQDNSFDVTLVLGPLYHLYEKEDQKRAVREAVRVTKPDGVIAIAYLSSDSIMVDWALKDRHLLQGYKKDFDENFKIINYLEGVFAAFYIQEFLELMSQFPVSFLHNVATDGMARHVKEEIDQLNDEEFELWLQYHFSTCERLELQGYSNHLLYIGRKCKGEKSND